MNNRSLDELLNDKACSTTMWQKIIQKCVDRNDDFGVEQNKQNLESCVKRYDAMIQAKEIEIKLSELRANDYKKKVLELANGLGEMTTFMNEALTDGQNIRGFVMVSQGDETKITDGFTTFSEYLKDNPNFMTVFRPHELVNRRASLGSVLYEIQSNGLMVKIDDHYDSSD